MARLSQIILILAVAGGTASINFVVNPSRPPWSEDALLDGEIRLADALILSPRVLWVDARSEADYSRAHIPSSLNLNEDRWDDLLPDVLGVWRPEQAIVIYCGIQQCRASHSVAERLKLEMGIENVFVLKGGWEAWQKYEK